jgi:hypothetical protein
MNGMEEAAFSTIHITPEQGQSYASVELSGYSPDSIDRDAVIAKVRAQNVFLFVCLSPALGYSWAVSIDLGDFVAAASIQTHLLWGCPLSANVGRVSSSRGPEALCRFVLVEG